MESTITSSKKICLGDEKPNSTYVCLFHCPRDCNTLSLALLKQFYGKRMNCCVAASGLQEFPS